jgi:diguanylate cyclase (GGDEF)-like protein/PAS domain S-box-containing protein
MSMDSTLPRLRVVLIEDSDGYAALVGALLAAEPEAPRLTRFARLEDGLRHLGHAPADCVLLDLGLPDGDGAELLERLRAIAPDVPVVVLTGREDEGLGVRLIRAGAQDYVVKGGEGAGALMRAILHAVERRRTGAREEISRLVREVAADMSALPARAAERRSARRLTVVGFAGVAALFTLQLLAGRLLGGLPTLYVFPIALVAARAGRRPGLAIAATAAVLATVASSLSAPDQLSIPTVVLRVAAFVAVALLARRSREDIQRSTTLLEAVVEGTSDLVYARDLAGRHLMVNQAVARLFGRRREELIGRTLEEVLEPDVAERAQGNDEAVLASGETRRQWSTMTVGGRERHFSTVKAPLRDALGRVVGVVAIARDETESRRLQAESARFFDLAPDMLATAGPDGRLERINGAWTATLGWSAEELRSRPLVEFLHPGDRHSGQIERLLSGEIDSGTCRVATKAGGWRELEWTARVADDRRVYAAARDVTDRVAMARALADGELRYRTLAESLPGSCVLTFDHELRFTFGAGDALAPLGARGSGVLGRTLGEVFPMVEAAVTPRYRAALGGRAQSFEFDGPDGRTYWTQITPLRDGDGAVTGGMLLAQDITGARRAERDRDDAEERFRTAFDQAPIGMAVVGVDGSLLRVNAALGSLSVRSEDELLGMRLPDLLHPDDRLTEGAQWDALLRGEVAGHSGELRWLRPAGDAVWVSVHGALVREADGAASHVLVQVQDITERRRLEARLRHEADHDPLTGLLNRRRFEEELDYHAIDCVRYGAEGALLLLDVDNLKPVNDQRGHAAGDAVLRRVAALLRDNLRGSDRIGRLGGDEFAVLLPRGTAEEAEGVAEKLVAALRADEEAGITISIGVAGFEGAPHGGRAVLGAADRALYAAKGLGRDAWAREMRPIVPDAG